jgi:hypothetical protein
VRCMLGLVIIIFDISILVVVVILVTVTLVRYDVTDVLASTIVLRFSVKLADDDDGEMVLDAITGR